jgi:vancomycin resistance protein VanJ
MTQVHTAEPITVGADRDGTGLRRLAYFRGWQHDMWRRGKVIAGLAVAVALLMLCHSYVPNRIGNAGSLIETFLPWFGLTVPVVLALALLRRSATALVAVLLPLVVWLGLFGGLVLGKGTSGGNFMVATHNVGVVNPDPVGAARELAASGADVLALEEMTSEAALVYGKSLAGTYKYHAVEGSVGMWSKYPMTGTKGLDAAGGDRGMRSVVETPHGKVAVYVVHLWSVRVTPRSGFSTLQRDVSAARLDAIISAEPMHRVMLLGDFNGTTNDRAFKAITSQMRSTQNAAGHGFGFSWPSSFPVMRIDQILVKGVKPTASWTLPKTGSDHLPVAARVTL